jgi:hypothetical protein
MLNPLAHLDKELHALPHGEPVPVAVVVDGQPGDILHDEVGPAFRRRAGVEDFGNCGVVHERERLAFGFESGHYFARIHADLDQLESHPAVHRLLLFGQPHLPHTAFPNQLQQLIVADDDACRGIATCRVEQGRSRFRQVFGCVVFHADNISVRA